MFRFLGNYFPYVPIVGADLAPDTSVGTGTNYVFPVGRDGAIRRNWVIGKFIITVTGTMQIWSSHEDSGDRISETKSFSLTVENNPIQEVYTYDDFLSTEWGYNGSVLEPTAPVIRPIAMVGFDSAGTAYTDPGFIEGRTPDGIDLTVEDEGYEYFENGNWYRKLSITIQADPTGVDDEAVGWEYYSTKQGVLSESVNWPTDGSVSASIVNESSAWPAITLLRHSNCYTANGTGPPAFSIGDRRDPGDHTSSQMTITSFTIEFPEAYRNIAPSE